MRPGKADTAAGGEGHHGQKKQTNRWRLGDVDQINVAQIASTLKRADDRQIIQYELFREAGPRDITKTERANDQAKISWTTRPWTSVKRKSRP